MSDREPKLYTVFDVVSFTTNAVLKLLAMLALLKYLLN